MQKETNGHCANCHSSSVPLVCAHCLLTHYCSTECANQHWFLGSHAREHDDADPMNLIIVGESANKGNVYLGGLEALHQLQGIQAVVSALSSHYNEQDLDQLITKSRAHLRLVVDDDPDENLERYFQYTADWIERHVQEGNNVLVHCAAGMSRSATILINYMLVYLPEFQSVQEALEYVREYRPIVHPNRGFMKQLEHAQRERRRK